jgi:hypothetical protein
VERWNSGFSKDIIHLKHYRQDEFCHLPNIDGFVKSPIAGHCEERSDEAISSAMADHDALHRIASLRSQ